VLKYYLGYNGKRINVLLSKEEAIKLLFETKGAIKGLSIMIYDENDKLIRQIPKKRG
jgi:uncharacterized FlaG/YvyC family protein